MFFDLNPSDVKKSRSSTDYHGNKIIIGTQEIKEVKKRCPSREEDNRMMKYVNCEGVLEKGVVTEEPFKKRMKRGGRERERKERRLEEEFWKVF